MPDAASRAARGRAGEELAARFLELEGYTVLARNTRHADVEVDLVARHGALLVLAEVKLRQDGLVSALDGLRPPQRRRLRRAAAALLLQHAWAESVRVDAVGLDWHDGELRIRHERGVV
jgi:putative endonuclease